MTGHHRFCHLMGDLDHLVNLKKGWSRLNGLFFKIRVVRGREGEQGKAVPGKVSLARMDQTRNVSGWDYEHEDFYT